MTSQPRAEVASLRTVQEPTEEEEQAFVEASRRIFKENKAEFAVLGSLMRDQKPARSSHVAEGQGGTISSNGRDRWPVTEEQEGAFVEASRRIFKENKAEFAVLGSLMRVSKG